jgi:hypothetical protein
MRHRSSLSKNQVITFRVTDHQLIQIEARAKEAKMSRAAYLESIVNTLPCVDKNQEELEAYQTWFFMSSQWNRQQNVVRRLTERVLSQDILPEGMKIVVRLNDLGAEALRLVDRLQELTVGKK